MVRVWIMVSGRIRVRFSFSGTNKSLGDLAHGSVAG